MSGSGAFDRAVALVLAFEGGYVDDPADPGGETKYGISKRDYPELDIAALTVEQAKAIYLTDWWLRYRLGQLPDQVAVKMLVLAVNMGIVSATRCLQRAIVACGGDVEVDGRLGPLTIAAAGALPADRLLDALRQEASRYYAELVADNPDLARFARGWQARALA